MYIVQTCMYINIQVCTCVWFIRGPVQRPGWSKIYFEIDANSLVDSRKDFYETIEISHNKNDLSSRRDFNETIEISQQKKNEGLSEIKMIQNSRPDCPRPDDILKIS